MNDLHSNEIVPLAAMIMDVNIEQSYHKRMGGDSVPFPGALLTDTFKMKDAANGFTDSVFEENIERLVRQQEAPHPGDRRQSSVPCQRHQQHRQNKTVNAYAVML